jgi:hypothetical protein
MSEPDAPPDPMKHPWMRGGGPAYPSTITNEGMAFKGLSIEDEVALRVFVAIIPHSSSSYHKDAETAFDAATVFIRVRNTYINPPTRGDTEAEDE